jgi:uncharacterized protein
VGFFFSLVLILSHSLWGADLQIPALRSPVMDEAGLLSAEEREDLNQLAYEIYTHQGPQITIFIVNDLQGLGIEEFSIKVVEKWQLGTKEKDNGLLIVIAKAERKMRIEVGQGLEGDITDYESNQYIKNILAPAFKEGAFHQGLRLVLEDMARKFNIQLKDNSGHIRRVTPPMASLNIPGPVKAAFPFLVALLVLGQFLLRNRPGLRGFYTASCLSGVGLFLGLQLMMILFIFLIGFLLGLIGLHNVLFALLSSRGGGGFSGGGGGSWDGGGGGFSGGGSSGSW